MGVFGDIGESLEVHVAREGVCETGDSEFDPNNTEEVLRVSIASSKQQLGFDIPSGNIIWYPTGSLVSCSEPLFYVLQQGYGVRESDGLEHSFYLNYSGSRTYSYGKNESIEPDERYLAWEQGVKDGDDIYDTTVRMYVEPLELPNKVITSVTTPIDWTEFGVKYIFVSSETNDVWNTLVFYYSGGTVSKSYILNEEINLPSSNLDPLVFEILASEGEYYESQTPIGYIDFSDIFDDADGSLSVKRYIKIQHLTLPDSIQRYCLVIGSTKGPLDTGETFTNDPTFGNSDYTTSYNTYTNRCTGIRILASGAEDTIYGCRILSMVCYARATAGTKYLEGAIYSCTRLTSGCKDFLYSTTRSTATTTATWRTLTFKEPQPIIYSGAMYYLQFAISGSARYYYTARSNWGMSGVKYWTDTQGWTSPLQDPGRNNRYRALYINYEPVGAQATRATKVYDPLTLTWSWKFPTIGVDSSQSSINDSTGVQWRWRTTDTTSTVFNPKSGSDMSRWAWTQENQDT